MNVKKRMYDRYELIQKLVDLDSEIIFDDETECRICYSIPNHCLTIEDNQKSVSLYL